MHECTPRADAFVLFGAAGDLACKQISPALREQYVTLALGLTG